MPDQDVTRDEVVQVLLEALNLRDMETVGHHMRVAEITALLGKALNLNDQQLVDLHYGALLHDIGKLGIPDGILFKPAALTEHEYEIMKRHTIMGATLLRRVRFLEGAVAAVESHHERWDGEGYLLGLKGEDIPLLARISAIAGTFDALTSQRFYRPAWSMEQALQYVEAEAGKSFDPQIVKVFLKVMKTEI